MKTPAARRGQRVVLGLGVLVAGGDPPVTDPHTRDYIASPRQRDVAADTASVTHPACEKEVRVDREQVIVTRDQYAQLLAECYHYQEALTQYQILLREQQAARGPDHPDTLRTRNNLAHWKAGAGDPAGADRTQGALG